MFPSVTIFDVYFSTVCLTMYREAQQKCAMDDFNIPIPNLHRLMCKCVKISKAVSVQSTLDCSCFDNFCQQISRLPGNVLIITTPEKLKIVLLDLCKCSKLITIVEDVGIHSLDLIILQHLIYIKDLIEVLVLTSVVIVSKSVSALNCNRNMMKPKFDQRQINTVHCLISRQFPVSVL